MREALAAIEQRCEPGGRVVLATAPSVVRSVSRSSGGIDAVTGGGLAHAAGQIHEISA